MQVPVKAHGDVLLQFLHRLDANAEGDARAPRLLVPSSPTSEASMATSSILGAERAPSQAAGRDVEALGPSDSSDSGSDVQGELDLASPTDLDDTVYGTVQPGLASDSDSAGTGERGAALPDEEGREAADILPDSVQSIGEDAAALEGMTDEELDVAELSDIDLPDEVNDDDPV
jgi:hypothetical protein